MVPSFIGTAEGCVDMKKPITLILLLVITLSLVCFINIEPVSAQSSGVVRVQGPTRVHAASTVSQALTLSSTPTYGNVLVMTALLNNGNISSISQTGVYWSRATILTNLTASMNLEIWYGNVWSTTSNATLVATPSASSSLTMIVCEYSGAYALDKTAYSQGLYNTYNNTALPTGTTATTTDANEVFVGAVSTYTGGTDQNNPGNSYTELGGIVTSQGNLAYLEYIASSTAATYSSESGYSTDAKYTSYLGSIATFGQRGLFNLGPSAGKTFTLNDTDQATQLTFVVQSGSLTGTAEFSTTSTVGTLEINATSTGTIRISENATGSIYVDGIYYTQGTTIYITSGESYTITWNSNPAPSPTVVSRPSLSYYYRSDTYTTLGVSGYGFDTDYTNTAATASISESSVVTVMYGYRIYLYASTTSEKELTAGTPDATVTLNTNLTGNVESTWSCPASSITLGYEALKIVLYKSIDGGSNWVSVASFVSPVLIAEGLTATTWTMSLNVNYTVTATNTYCTVSWGTSDYRSGISGLSFDEAAASAIGFWRLTNGDLVGFTFGSYIDLVGVGGFYILCLFGVFASLYRRYGHVGIIVSGFILFAGPGSLLVLVLGSYALWAAAAAIIVLILAGTFIIWRIVR